MSKLYNRNSGELLMVLHCVGCWPKVLPQGMSLCNGFGLCVGSSAMIQCINCRHSWPLFGLIPSHQSPYFRRRKWHLLRVIMRLHRQQQHRHRKQKQTATAETTPTPTYCTYTPIHPQQTIHVTAFARQPIAFAEWWSFCVFHQMFKLQNP